MRLAWSGRLIALGITVGTTLVAPAAAQPAVEDVDEPAASADEEPSAGPEGPDDDFDFDDDEPEVAPAAGATGVGGGDDFDDFDDDFADFEGEGKDEFDDLVDEAKGADGAFSLDKLGDMVPGLEMRWGGRIQADLRFRLQDKSVGAWYAPRPWKQGIARNENLFGLRFASSYGMVSAKADIDFVLYGFIQDVDSIRDLSRREKTDPYRFDVHQLYVKLQGLGLDGLDLTVGHQQTLWGVGDQFNPTNNVNPDDVEDVLLFGDQRGQFMVKADYFITDEWSLTGLLVPVFQPALLPRSARLGLARVDRVPVFDGFLRRRILAEQYAAEAELVDYPTVVQDVVVNTPRRDIENVQFAYRLAGNILGQDVSVSYYNGFSDFPQPRRTVTNQNSSRAGCNPDDPDDCINGVLETTTTLTYPRMHVYGFNMAGEIPWLADLSEAFSAIGYRVEAALIVPREHRLRLENSTLDLTLITQPRGEYDYDDDGVPGGPEAVVVPDTPFAKWTVGLDYTFNKYMYLNLQWVHGLADEYGAGDWITEGYVLRRGTVDTSGLQTAVRCALPRNGDECAREILRPRIGDYIVMGWDFTFLNDKLLTRLFTIFDVSGVKETYWDDLQQRRVEDDHSFFTAEGFGAVIYPEVNYNFGNGFDLGAGALVYLGKPYGKFASAEAGGSLAWMRTRFQF